MRIGVYVDGYNLYYGGRSLCGRGQPGWRWLDLRAVAIRIVRSQSRWAGAHVERIVYCTARIKGSSNPGGQQDQDTYLRALVAARSVDHIEFGTYVSRTARSPLAIPDSNGAPQLVTSQWPVMIQDATGSSIPDARFMVSYAKREEKGSDVNVATHLLLDVTRGAVDAAVVISNDSDLRLPIVEARRLVPVGTVNPTSGHLAGALRGTRDEGAARHWWYQLRPADFTTCQLPAKIDRLHTPPGW
ncbi:NYN domain-containing protein [Frankia sp. AgB1.9]|uniref:NYN domain-containing protein n=1 Tax=unclassified Frankia TaxID=2632575 RepID=UPI0027DBB660|nr:MULTISPECIES: NYN domain-containing protein [unclassified Frankia]MBL7494295.1 NYN domain-containing protein [Frankia sp. AgW1.1]MBL7552516.1 NYN domain-containing protein [Frankia sp. AgB1.9]